MTDVSPGDLVYTSTYNITVWDKPPDSAFYQKRAAVGVLTSLLSKTYGLNTVDTDLCMCITVIKHAALIINYELFGWVHVGDLVKIDLCYDRLHT